MTKKTESLSFPTDPLAALRQLQDIDTPSNDIPTEPPEGRDRVTALPETHVTGNEVTSVATLGGPGRGGNEFTRLPTPKQTRREVVSADEERAPIAAAVKEFLSRPYAAEGTRSPMAAGTMKMRAEVWERLGWAAKLTGRAKQDIVSDALKDYFRKLLKEL